jgi:flagellar hook-length control protein FliK
LAAAPLRTAGPELQAVIRDLLGRTLNGERLKGADIQRLFKQSGLFGEAQLAAGQTQGAQQSGKAAVMQLQSLALAAMQNLDADPVELRQLESVAERAAAMLNSVNNQQLASLPRDDGSQRWLVTLPLAWRGQFRDVRLQIEREPPAAAAAEAVVGWRVVVNLELPQLGDIEVALRMRAERMSVDFNCSEARTEKLLNAVMPQLASRLAEKAFRVEALQARAVAAAKSEPESAAIGSTHSPGFEAKA